jgi:hypothetical protein
MLMLMDMGKIVPHTAETLEPPEAPNPAWAFAVGMIYVFGTRPGWQLLAELERAIRHYAADPAALIRLVREHRTQIRENRSEIIEVSDEPQLPPSR